jgi:hypothetical protein
MHESMSRLLDFARKATATTAEPILHFADLGRRLNASPQVLTNWKKRGISREAAEKAEELFGCSRKWLLTGMGSSALAHPVSLATVTIDPQDDSARVEWGSMSHAALPETFRTEVPDDAMADRVKKGHIVRFARSHQPRPGDGVLVEDSTGAWYFRLYSPGAQGRFSAVALNPAYQTLDSERDGLKVLAVLVGVPEARWG